MPDTDETKAAVEYWDRVAASSKRRADTDTVQRNKDRAVDKDARDRAAAISLER